MYGYKTFKDSTQDYGCGMKMARKKRFRHSEETKRKLSEARRGKNNPFYGKKHTKENIRRWSEMKTGSNNPCFGRTGKKNPMFGRHHSEAAKKIISKANKGKIISKTTREKISKGTSKEKNHNWLGKKAKYSAFHERVRKWLGKAKRCDVCGKHKRNKNYQWANLTGDYNNTNDYKQMCVSCHRKYDFKERPRDTNGRFL